MEISKRFNSKLLLDYGIKILYWVSILTSVLLLIIFLYRSFKYGIRNYQLGELLLNYNCGFIRRGLIGSLLLLLFDLIKFNPFLLLKLCIPILYIFVFVSLVFKANKNLVLLIALFISPYGFMFYINDWGAYGYKDIFIILFFLLGLKNLQSECNIRKRIVFYLILIIGFLIHENMLVVSLPFFLLFQSIQKLIKIKSYSTDFVIDKKKFVYFVLFGFYVFGVYKIGNHDIVEKIICLSDQFKSLEIIFKLQSKNGIEYPLSWLDKSLLFGFEFVQQRNFNFSILCQFTIDLFLMLAFIFLLPILFFNFNNFIYVLKKLFLYLFLVVLSFLFLLLFTYDWGRWLHLFYMHSIITLIYLMPQKNIDFKKNMTLTLTIVFFQFILFLFISIPHFYSIGKIEKIKPFFNHFIN